MLPEMLSLVSCFLVVSVSAYCKSSISMMALKGHAIRSFQSPNIDECFHLCRKEQNCRSINYYVRDSLCEHNSHTISEEPDHAVKDIGASYFDNVTMQYIDCSVIYKFGERRSGVYTVKPDSQEAFQVYCDMTTDGGGWTVFQRRQDGSVDFYRGWQEYKTGFGNLTDEFWLGNDYIHRLTARKASILRVDLEDWVQVRKYAKYGSFSISDESGKYKLNVAKYSGNAGDSLTKEHNQMAFSTKDRDNDEYHVQCAVIRQGAWWYNKCYNSNLNGYYFIKNHKNVKGASWDSFHDSFSLKFTEIKIRPQ